MLAVMMTVILLAPFLAFLAVAKSIGKTRQIISVWIMEEPQDIEFKRVMDTLENL